MPQLASRVQLLSRRQPMALPRTPKATRLIERRRDLCRLQLRRDESVGEKCAALAPGTSCSTLACATEIPASTRPIISTDRNGRPWSKRKASAFRKLFGAIRRVSGITPSHSSRYGSRRPRAEEQRAPPGVHRDTVGAATALEDDPQLGFASAGRWDGIQLKALPVRL